ncbi:MAG: deoxyribose-phosphate aldolase [bacterium]|nr:deoxyribose-phosphate aldolase [bacterium]
MELNRYIDHTLLKPAATRADIAKLCAEAKEYRFASVCVNSAHIAEVAAALAGTDVAPCCVVGFPLGAMETEAKAFEAARAAALGAKEIDMVMDIGAAKEGDFARVEADIAAVVSAIQGRAKLKVILECCLLTDEEKTAACLAAKRAGADFVKTSTGFSTGGATEHDVALMRAAVGDDMGVKASGGIRTQEDALRMIAAGASRIGASAGIAIVTAKD